MKIKHILAGLAAAALLLTPLAITAQVTLPQVPIVNSTDLIQDIPNGVPVAGNQYVSALSLAGYVGSQPTKGNVLIGGDSTTNLYQRGTTGSSVTTTLTYGGPDRWAYWSGTNTAMTVSRTTTAADLPSSSYASGFKMARTSGQTGVVQVCMMQVVETANSYQFAGTTAELSFHATAGSTFSAASSNVTAYIIYGTGSNEGAAAAAFGLNAGGGAGAGWTGQANATAAVIPISTANGRYAAVGTIPATATEIAVALCFTPVGTASTNDYVAWSGIQLVRNPALAAKVSTTSGYACTNPIGTLNAINCTAFDRRGIATETMLQQRYAWTLVEPAADVCQGAGYSSTTTAARITIKTPTTMRIAPTITSIGATLANTTWKVEDANTPIVLATPFLATFTANTVDQLNLTATTAASQTAGRGVLLCGAAGGGILLASAEL